MKEFMKIIQIIWELPQNTVGFIVKKLFKTTPYTTYKDATVYSWGISGGMSLGKYIFVPYKTTSPNQYSVQQFIKHEYGHTVQSKYLGWFYLLVIGIPSLIWAQCFEDYRKRTNTSYYAFYTESSADKLGGVEKRER